MTVGRDVNPVTELGYAVKRMMKKIEEADKKIDVLDDHVRLLEIELGRAEHEIRILKA